MNILGADELTKSHFADVIKLWGENLKKRIDENKQSAEEESNKIWKKIPENLK
jgi:cyclopropane fatty-acyl-phospholipid synthase-like methyltransferase